MSDGLQSVLAFVGLLVMFGLGSYTTYTTLRPRFFRHADQTPRHSERAKLPVLFEFEIRPWECIRRTKREDKGVWAEVFPEAPQSDEDGRLWLTGMVLAHSEVDGVNLLKRQMQVYVEQLNLSERNHFLEGLPDFTGFEFILTPLLEAKLVHAHSFDRGHYEYGQAGEDGWKLLAGNKRRR